MAILTKRTPKPSPASRPTIAPRFERSPEQIRDIQVCGTGFIHRKTGVIDHYFSCHAIGFVVSGCGLYQVDGGPLKSIQPGYMFAVYPGPRFHYGAELLTPCTTWDEYYITFYGEGLKRWEQAGWFPTDGRVYPLVRMDEHAERYREIHRILQRGWPGDADRAVLLAERMLMEMYYARIELNPSQAPNERQPAFERILAHCQRHFTEDIDFEALADEHAVSYSLLRQRLKQITGLPPAQYLLKVRCNEARTLLSDTRLSIKEISDRVGLPDPYHFSRVFKRQTGLAPREYRQQSVLWAGKKS